MSIVEEVRHQGERRGRNSLSRSPQDTTRGQGQEGRVEAVARNGRKHWSGVSFAAHSMPLPEPSTSAPSNDVGS